MHIVGFLFFALCCAAAMAVAIATLFSARHKVIAALAGRHFLGVEEADRQTVLAVNFDRKRTLCAPPLALAA